MNLKGHTKIELFDAKTGELEQEIHENNMITNAISLALNPPVDFLVEQVPISKILTNVMPIQSVGIGGVMLLNNNLSEDKNVTSLPKNNNIVGYAGGVYSGTNVYRGTYNSNESKSLANGYRHVWDFATDKACGDISCVCLTHQAGGNTGHDLLDNIYNALDLGVVASSYGAKGRCVGLVSKGVYCYAYTSANNDITLVYRSGFDSDKIKLVSKPNANVDTIEEQVTIPFSKANFAIDNIGNFIHYVDKNGILTMVRSVGNYNIHYCCINIITRTLTDEGVISVNTGGFPAELTTNNFAVCGCIGDYFICSASESTNSASYNSLRPYIRFIVNKNGNFVKILSESRYSSWSGSYGLYDARLDAIYIDSNYWVDSSLNYFKHYNPRIGSNEGVLGFTVYCYKDIYPYFLRQSNGTIVGANLIFDRTYLASINNLATTVTKTSEQTMKITYDITEE